MKANQTMKQMGFVPAKELELRPRLIIAVCGLDKQGKTHFGLSAFGPVAYINFDEGLEGVVHKHIVDKDIQVLDMVLPNVLQGSEIEVQEEAQVEWAKFHTAFYGSLRSKDVRSIVVDTATELRELQLMTHFGKANEIMPWMYRGPNAEFRKLLRDTLKFDKNVIFLHKMKKTYVGKGKEASWNGKYELSGFQDTRSSVQVNSQIWRYAIEDGGDFVLTVMNCRHDPDMAGEELEGPLCSFPFLARMVLPDADWGD